MAPGIQKVKIGSYECTVISDGTHPGAPAPYTSPSDFLFPGADRDVLAFTLREHNIELKKPDDWIIPYAALLVRTGSLTVLMDTGADGLGPDTGKLPANLAAVGVGPDDVDIIVHTHAHRDHIGGDTDSAGSLVYQKARYFMWKDEWDFWNAPGTKLLYEGTPRQSALEWAMKNLSPLAGRVELLEKEGEFLPGISAIGAPGHTPGHIAVSIKSGDEELLFLADTVHHVIQMEHPEWATAIDTDRAAVNATRRRLFRRAAENHTLVYLPHLPFPGLGYVIPRGDGWTWQPAEL